MKPQAQRLSASPDNLKYSANLLRQNELVAVPTETVYGLAANALSEAAVRKVFEVKGRPLIDPLITHFTDLNSARQHIIAPDILDRISKAFWPGPLTVIVQKKPSIPGIVTAGLQSVAIRIPSHPVFRELLSYLDFPLAAPSANPFGYVSPTTADHVNQSLGTGIKAIIDGGPSSIGIESTIIDIRDSREIRILRPGPVTIDQIAEAIGVKVSEIETALQKEALPQDAPGMLKKHYSPSTRLELFESENEPSANQTAEFATVYQKRPNERSANPTVDYWLSENGDLSEVAQNLFHLIRSLDDGRYKMIKIELAPNAGLGKAINDRLRRAAEK